MRFILAIIAFVIATALIGIGVAERTVFLPPSAVKAETTTSASPYLLIDSAVLQAETGSQTLSLSGSSTVFTAYGRTDDVKAWLNGSSYDSLAFDPATKALSSTVVPADADGAANVASGSSNPAGSDLWLEEYSAPTSMNRTFTLPAGYSIIVADDGTAPAPSNVSISWPLDNSTPLATPLLLIGAFFILVGLALLLLGLQHMRRSQGPRRKPPALGPGKRFSPSRTNAIESGVRRGRRSINKSVSYRRAFGVLVPAVIIGSVALTGCSVQTLPSASAETVAPTVPPSDAVTPSEAPTEPPTPGVDTPTPVPTDETGPPPAVTEGQLNTILAKISATTTAADAVSDATGLAARFTGPALELRKETYAIRAAGVNDYPAPQAILPGPASVVLPQSTGTWPRTVFTVVEKADDPSIAPLSLVLEQETARSPYKVYYAMALEPGAVLPPVAPASVGTSRLANDTKLLSITPGEVAAGYADVLAVGEASPEFADFDATGDTLRTAVGVDFKNAQKANLPNTASIDFAKVAGDGETIALATNESGAIVALNIRESVTAKPTVAGATVTPTKGGAVAAASGVTVTTKGTEAIYDYQLLFSIPPSGDTSKVKLLGFAQGLLSAKELP